MRVWLHKESGEMALVKPFFDMESARVGDRFVVAYGAEQDGWLFQNKHDCTFVFPLGVEIEFEDLGEL